MDFEHPDFQPIILQDKHGLPHEFRFRTRLAPTGLSSQLERLEAIGPTIGLPEILKKAFDPGSEFEPIPSPNPGGWLAEHYQERQELWQHHARLGSYHHRVC